MAKLEPLLAQIEETDRLIDRVVYKLYGLTEEEIEIVKESLRKRMRERVLREAVPL